MALLLLGVLPAQAWAAFDTVVLDPGHGGWDKGGLRNVKVPEKKMTLLTSLVVREMLEEAGLKVIMTRETDVYIPLSDRVSIANAHDDAIFVSVHYNADYGSSGHGIETYCARGSSKSVPLRDAIHRRLIKGTGARNRGVRTAGFYVLRHTQSVAVLVEGGFLSNPREAKKIADEDYRRVIAECIVDGILDYRNALGGSKLTRARKKEKPKQDEEAKPKEATPVDESKLPQTAKKPETKKKAPAPKSAEAKKPAEVKKPAAAPKPPATNSVVSTTEPPPSAKPEEPKGTNVISIAPPAETPPSAEIGPKNTPPETEAPPPQPASPAPVTNQFRATGIGLRE